MLRPATPDAVQAIKRRAIQKYKLDLGVEIARIRETSVAVVDTIERRVAGVRRQMKTLQWPYTLPIWRSHYRAVSPDGQRVAQIDPAREESMGNPTYGLLCVTGGPHIERCNPSFVWSDDSRYLAVPQVHGFFNRQRLLIVAFAERCVFASKERTWYFQPESFSGGHLIVTVEPFRSARAVTFQIPSELAGRFKPLKRRYVRWPESPG